jgi:RNA polymerase sigma factor (sigma-70 family)
MSNSSQNEIELLEASIQGSADAFEAIVKKYQSFVCAITFSATADIGKSEDIAQETFLHVWHNLSQLKDLNKFRSWLISIVRNTINDSLRKQKRDIIDKAHPIDQIEDRQISQTEPAQNVLTRQQQDVVQKALMDIPDKYREPLVLFYRYDKSVKNIAEELELSEDTVKQHLSRGRELLREQVASMVESSISRTGPTSAFTAVVMASIVGIAVKSTAAAAVAAGTSVISGITAKIIAAAAVVAMSVGAVVMYSQFIQPEQNNGGSVFANQTDTRSTISDSNHNQASNSIATVAAAPPTSAISQTTIAANIAQRNPANAVSSNQNINSNTRDAASRIIALDAKPVSSPYEYFLFTRYTKEPSTKTLVLAHITDKAIELRDIMTEDFGKYRWGDPICVTAGILYSVSYSTLYNINLLTGQAEQLSVRSTGPLYDTFNFNTATSFADNCLYGLSQKGNITTLRQLDFERGAFRDIADVSKAKPDRIMAIAPDKKHLAYFTGRNNQSRGEGGYLLTIVEVESGKITQPAKPIKFIMPMIASSFPSIPVIWLDTETVAFIRSEAPEGENEFSTTRGGVNMLSMANINTGKMEDITPLPGNPYMQFAPNLVQDETGIGHRVVITRENVEYLIDIKNRKLVENDLIAGDYRFAFGHIHSKEQDLGSVKSRYFKVSADGRRAMWMSNETTNMDSADLYYHDPAQQKPVAIARVYNSVGLWLKSEDLKPKPSKTPLSNEWAPLKDLSKNLPVQTYTDTRKNIRDYLTCTIKTDKNTYQLHEPVQVTLTLTNKSNTDVTVSKPYVIESAMRPLIGLKIKYPAGQATINCGAQPYSPADEKILLKAKESFVSTDTIEVNAVGDYSLEYQYEMSPVQQEYKGAITTEPAVFKVQPVSDSAKEKQLFEAKFARIMDQFHREIAMDPNWFGHNNISNELTGLPGMGPAAAPFIIKAIDSETNKYARKMLLNALSLVAGPQYIPFFKQQLINGETDSVCNWTLKIHRRNGTDETTRQQAVDALLAGTSNKDIKVRKEVCSYLTRIYSESIESYFKKAIEDENEQIRLVAGYYLAAAKWLELADWLKQAASEPTYERYISASAVIKKLEQQWNISKGQLPALSKDDFKIAEKIQEAGQYYKKVMNDWLSWAKENPRASFLFFEEYRMEWWKNDPLRQ